MYTLDWLFWIEAQIAISTNIMLFTFLSKIFRKSGPDVMSITHFYENMCLYISSSQLDLSTGKAFCSIQKNDRCWGKILKKYLNKQRLHLHKHVLFFNKNIRKQIWQFGMAFQIYAIRLKTKQKQRLHSSSWKLFIDIYYNM